MPPNKENDRGVKGHASVLRISKGRSSEITELSEVVNGATETAMAAALRAALARKAVRS